MSISLRIPSESSDFEPDRLDRHWCYQGLQRQWLPAVVVAGSVLGATAAILSQQPSLYEAQGQLIFEGSEGSSQPVTEEADSRKRIGSNARAAQGNFVATQIQVLQSQTLARQVIESLKLKQVEEAPLKVTQFLERLAIESVPETAIVTLSYQSPDPQEAAAIVNRLMTVYLSRDLAQNRATMQAAQAFLTKQLPTSERQLKTAAAALQRFKEQNDLISLEAETGALVDRISDVDNTLAETLSNLAASQRRVARLQEAAQLSPQDAIAFRDPNQSPAVHKVLQAYQAIQDQIAVERVRYLDNAPIIQVLRHEEAALAQQLQTRQAEVLKHEAFGTQLDGQMLQMSSQMSPIQQQLTQDLVAAETERQSLNERAISLRQTQALYRQRLRALPQLERSQRQLEHKLKVAQLTYDHLLNQFQSLQVLETQQLGHASILTQAVIPEQAIGFNHPLGWGIGVTLSLTLGAATALLLNSQDQSLTTVEAIQKRLGYPLLGQIPNFSIQARSVLSKSTKARAADKTSMGIGSMGAAAELPARDNPYSPASAAYEMLQTSLEFVTPDRRQQRLVVTSALPGEGKSSVCANLAVVMAQMGRRVLIIDANFHHPHQHELWETSHLAGLSDVIIGRAGLKAALRDVMINVTLLPCGTIPPNPMAILSCNRMMELLKRLQAHYDYILIDTPPVGLFPDALALGKLADGVLPVVSPGIADIKTAEMMRTLFTQSAQPVIGLVLNGVTEAMASGRSRFSGPFDRPIVTVVHSR